MDSKDGLLVVDKAAGMTSFDVVRKVRKLAGTRKVGHTGTLDPDATGVLAIALGRCTKLSRFLTFDEKRYAFSMRFGFSTDTDDDSGEVLREASWEHIEESDLEKILAGFQGEIEQVPPIYSAIKVDGKRAHAMARAGEDFELDARKVMIYDLKVTDWSPPLASLEVRCGSGTYVRSLARDIGRALGSEAHTTAIRRTSVGPFSLADAVTLEELSTENFWSRVLSPLQMVQSLPRVEVDDEAQQKIVYGQPVEGEGDWEVGESVAAHDGKGNLVAILERKEREEDAARLWPRRVMIAQ